MVCVIYGRITPKETESEQELQRVGPFLGLEHACAASGIDRFAGWVTAEEGAWTLVGGFVSRSALFSTSGVDCMSGSPVDCFANFGYSMEVLALVRSTCWTSGQSTFGHPDIRIVFHVSPLIVNFLVVLSTLYCVPVPHSYNNMVTQEKVLLFPK